MIKLNVGLTISNIYLKKKGISTVKPLQETTRRTNTVNLILSHYLICYFQIMTSFLIAKLILYLKDNGSLKILWNVEYLLLKSKSIIFHNFFKTHISINAVYLSSNRLNKLHGNTVISLALSVREPHLCLCKQVGSRPAAE